MRRLLLVAWVGLLAGCQEPPLQPDPPYLPPADQCDAPALDQPFAFAACNVGGGIFGTWESDALGLPSYRYGLDQNADERARYFNTEGIDRREHWAPFGNSRVNALWFNDGYIEVLTQDRGPSYLNKFDEQRRNYAGGFSWLDDGEATWSTAYKWRPLGARTSRRVGMGYAETSMSYRGVRLTRRSFSPAGDVPLVIDEVVIENEGRAKKKLRHYEYWDVARRPVEIAWVVSGSLIPDMPKDAAARRDARNGLFDEAVAFDPAARTLGLRRRHAAGTTPPPREKPDPVDHYPGDPFLAALIGPLSDVYVDQTPFFGEGGPAAPSQVVARAPGEGLEAGPKGRSGKGTGQARMFVMRSDLELLPGEKALLRFAYGYAPMGEPWALEPSWSEPSADLLGQYVDALRPHLMYFATEEHPFLHRELAWHAYQVETSVGVRDYFGQHVVPQGSAYLYLHGADGAARDVSLFALPLVYTHPSLAKEQLALNMKLTHAQGHRISYAFQGHGMLDDGAGAHHSPSDLDIFFLWALSEYLGATGDLAFLDAPMPFWPVEAAPNAKVWDHLVGATRHLFDTVGTGPHGLIRVGTGDWSDGIVFEAKNRDLAVREGESVPNSQMALVVLPRVAELVEPKDPALAQEIRAKLGPLCEAVKRTWTGSQFGRAYFGDGKLVRGDVADLEAAVWALLGDCWASSDDRARLVERVRTQLDEPSPAGAMLGPQGQVWPAISGLLTAGYARSHPELAFAHLSRNTLVGHATAYPRLWAGIWSGADGHNGPSQGSTFGDAVTAPGPGEVWFSPVTPMSDFPVMNNNQHSLPQLAALRLAGLEATARGLSVHPKLGRRSFALRTQLLDLDQRPSKLWGTYRKPGAAPRTLEVRPPDGERIVAARYNQSVWPVGPDPTRWVIEVPAGPATVTFELDTAPR